MNRDITFCTNDECSIAIRCDRSLKNLTMTKARHLSVSYFFPSDSGDCDYYIENDKTENED